MAMAMGVASMVVTIPRNSSLVCRAAASNTGEKQGFFEWVSGALNKDAMRETDELLGKVDGAKSNGKAAPAGKKAAVAGASKKAGFNFFGKK